MVQATAASPIDAIPDPESIRSKIGEHARALILLRKLLKVSVQKAKLGGNAERREVANA